MPIALELHFDRDGEERVRSWAAVRSPAGMGSESVPHVSLLVAESIDLPAAKPRLDRFAAATRRFSLSLSAVGIFPGNPPVVFLAPKVTRDLLNLHERFVGEFTLLVSGIWDYYLPGNWVPHCALGIAVPPTDLSGLPLTVRVSGLILIEFPDYKRLHHSALASEILA